MRLRKYKNKKRNISNYFTRGIIIIIISLVCAFLIINNFAKRIDKIIMPMAESIVRRYVSTIVNDATIGIEFDKELFVIDKNEKNEIKMVTYNSYEVTKLTNTITTNIQDNLLKLENSNGDDFVVTEIPFGMIFDNVFLRNVGPKIKIRLDIYGDVLTELRTEVKPYGINNALVEVSVYLEANARVVLPFVSKDVKITNVIPISINIVNGSIPEAYISTYK